MRTLLLTIALLLTFTGVAGATCCGGGGDHTIRTPQPKTSGLAGRPIFKPVPPRPTDTPPTPSPNK